MDKEYFEVIIGEEVGTKVKAFLIAPNQTSVRVGDMVVAHGLKFRAMYVDNYCAEEGIEMTILRVALGRPMRVTMTIKEEPVKWEDSENDLD